jgi:hypothetical protein
MIPAEIILAIAVWCGNPVPFLSGMKPDNIAECRVEAAKCINKTIYPIALDFECLQKIKIGN